VKRGCQNGNSGTSKSHSVADEKTAYGIASIKIVSGRSPAVQRLRRRPKSRHELPA
jgi:hypothetical protein